MLQSTGTGGISIASGSLVSITAATGALAIMMGGSGNATAAGGAASLVGGASAFPGVAAGIAVLRGGDASGASGVGGAVFLQGGKAIAGTDPGTGGSVSIAGYGLSDVFFGGNVIISGGNANASLATSRGGSVTLAAGLGVTKGSVVLSDGTNDILTISNAMATAAALTVSPGLAAFNGGASIGSANGLSITAGGLKVTGGGIGVTGGGISVTAGHILAGNSGSSLMGQVSLVSGTSQNGFGAPGNWPLFLGTPSTSFPCPPITGMNIPMNTCEYSLFP